MGVLMKVSPIYEMPFMASTTLNPLFNVSRETLNRNQSAVRKMLGIKEPPHGQLGTGRFRIDPSPVGLSLQIMMRWGKVEAKTFCQTVVNAGFGELAQRYKIDDMIKDITDRVKVHLRKETEELADKYNLKNVPPQMRINNAIQEVVLENQEFKTFACDYSIICERVEAELDQVQRYAATVERIESDYVLADVELGPQQVEPRKFDRTLTDCAGIDPGESFVIYEQSWSPDTKSNLLQPAFRDTQNAIEIPPSPEEPMSFKF